MSPALAGGFLTTAPPGKPQGGIFKGQVREGSHRVWEQLVHSSDWLMMRSQGGLTGVNIIDSQTPVGLGATCSWSSVVNFFHLVGVSASVKQLRNVPQMLSSRYFREELQQRTWGGVRPRKAP